MAKQVFRLIAAGHQHQPPMGIDTRLEPGPSGQPERLAELPGNGELALAAEGDGGHG